jgi:serine/threonine-protein kinase RIO1
MKIPKRLQPLVDDGLIDEVLFQLMSGKEAQVFVVRANDEIRCAKVYKEANKRRRGALCATRAAPAPCPKAPATAKRKRKMPG